MSTSLENALVALALDDDPAVTVIIAVTIMTSPDHDSLVAIPILAFADYFTVAITIAVAMTVTDGDAYARQEVPDKQNCELLRTDEAMPEKRDRQNKGHERQEYSQQIDELVRRGEQTLLSGQTTQCQAGASLH